ncbi:MAG: class I SAM-dependent methyltransferase [Anaerolineales bacterium]|nr:class I SAM-dependent methyltransferase [Anaerolineales bacterium]
MGEVMSRLEFSVMALAFSVRDAVRRPKKVLAQTGIRPGDQVLDFGCGTGSFSFAAAKIVGDRGLVYAADILPLAVERIALRLRKKGVRNIQPLCTGCDTGLKEASMDAILVFDTFHMCDAKEQILQELFRVLKPDGCLYFSDHHMKEKNIQLELTRSGLFRRTNKNPFFQTFLKTGPSGTPGLPVARKTIMETAQPAPAA